MTTQPTAHFALMRSARDTTDDRTAVDLHVLTVLAFSHCSYTLEASNVL